MKREGLKRIQHTSGFKILDVVEHVRFAMAVLQNNQNQGETTMGGGYNDSQASRARTQARSNAPQQQVFEQQSIGCLHESMSVLGLIVREARDSEEHPTSVPIIWNTDGTGSMNLIPQLLATKVFPDFMDLVLTVEPHPQVLFGTFLDYHDGSGANSLQQGQFESS